MKIFFMIALFVILLAKENNGQQTFSFFNNRMTVSLTNLGDRTQVSINSVLGNGVNPGNAWVALGFNDKPQMVIFYRKSDSIFCVYYYFQWL